MYCSLYPPIPASPTPPVLRWETMQVTLTLRVESLDWLVSANGGCRSVSPSVTGVPWWGLSPENIHHSYLGRLSWKQSLIFTFYWLKPGTAQMSWHSEPLWERRVCRACARTCVLCTHTHMCAGTVWREGGEGAAVDNRNASVLRKFSELLHLVLLNFFLGPLEGPSGK